MTPRSLGSHHINLLSLMDAPYSLEDVRAALREVDPDTAAGFSHVENQRTDPASNGSGSRIGGDEGRDGQARPAEASAGHEGPPLSAEESRAELGARQSGSGAVAASIPVPAWLVRDPENPLARLA